MDSTGITAIIIAIITTVGGAISTIIAAKIAANKSSLLRDSEEKLREMKKIHEKEMEHNGTDDNTLILIEDAGEILKKLIERPANSIDIIGSTVNSFRETIRDLAKCGIIDSRTEINILFRMGKDGKRYSRLRKSGDEWYDLSKIYSLNLRFHYVVDCDYCFLGAVFDRRIGIIGIVHKRAEQTMDDPDKLMLLFKYSPNPTHRYIIGKFLKCFDFKKPPNNYTSYQSINDAVDEFISQHDDSQERKMEQTTSNPY